MGDQLKVDRTQLLILVLVVGVGWYLYKRYVKKDRGGRGVDGQESPEVWYLHSQERIEQMDEQLRSERETAWQAMSDEEKLDKSEIFINNTFGLSVLRGYSFDDKLRIGNAHFLTRSDEQSGDGRHSRK